MSYIISLEQHFNVFPKQLFQRIDYDRPVQRAYHEGYMAKWVYPCHKHFVYNSNIVCFCMLFWRALKDQGYESDSTLVFRKKEQALQGQLNSEQQKQAYLQLQAGGEVPVHGFRKPAPEKPKGMCFV